MSSIRHGLDIERQGNSEVTKSSPVLKDETDLLERAEQGCFVCLESYKQGQYAVLVPCLRPPESFSRLIQKKDRNGKSISKVEKKSTLKSDSESDYEIYQRLLDTCYEHLGRWKRWLPYYGIIDILEVNFQFAANVEPNGRYPIYMKPVNINEVREECNKAIARHPTGPFYESGGACVKGYEHSDECILGMEEWAQPCIRDEAEKAQKRLDKLDFLLHLKDCYARNPGKADGCHILKGMAQESCIYNVKGPKKILLPVPDEEFQGTTWTRGLHFMLGWQTGRIYAELPFRLSCVSLAVALIWICMALWRGAGGDWGTAFAFAQVVAASLAIVITYVRL
ncbi:hypothetical protein FPOAC1_007097 [Fusarium poae]|uniref:hypothetical protein n=1 Tax=Fusarium poae TaxID=36050 RepID=UPI001CE7B6D9|nr:hypothetical protein FPOAC1_007097 [Fusarium poae]KAG8673778.1 hypothetical protein FPOAC1_007097 [Fusarium poae]